MRLVDFTNKITNFLNSVWIYAVEDVGGAPTDGYVVMEDLIDYIKTNEFILGIDIGLSTTDLISTSSTFVNFGTSVSLFTKKTTSKLEIDVSFVVEHQNGVNATKYNLHYSLDNGATYSNLEFGEVGVVIGSYNENFVVSKKIILDAPAIKNTCLFQLQARTSNTGQTFKILGQKQIILKVTELNI